MSIDVLIKPDPRSEGLTPDWVEKQFAAVPLSEKVPENIRRMVDLAKDLVYFGYFRYEFYNMAFFYLCLTFEASLREKYGAKKSDRLGELVERARYDGLFPRPFEGKVKFLKGLRDDQAHASGRTVMPLSVRAFHLTILLINCIFDAEAREVYPAVFAREIAQNKRFTVLMEGLSRVSKYHVAPGQSFEVAGSAEVYEQGPYACAQCAAEQIVGKDHAELHPCEKCGETIFFFRQ